MKPIRRHLRALLVGALLFLAPSLSFAALRVVASTAQIADIVSHVGGDRVELKVLMGPGVDPHLYKATARDVIDLQRADLILYNGLHLEGRLAEAFARVDKPGRPVIAVAESIPEERLLASSDYDDSYDPHVWFDPALWVLVVDATAEAMAQADPENATFFRENGASYRAEVEALQEWAERRIEMIPAEHRVLVTSHDAYNYFGRAFGIEVVGVQGVSTATEAGMADITATADLIKRQGIPAIFIESSVSPDTIRRISADSGAVVGGELFSDALGSPGDLREGIGGGTYDVGTYIGVFKYNVDVIARALK